MQSIVYTIKLNMKDTGVTNSGIRLKQGDSGIQFHINVYLGDGSIGASTTEIPDVVFRRSDGSSVIGKASKVDSRWYKYVFMGNELEIPGKVLCDVKFTSGNLRNSTASFSFECVPDTISNQSDGSDLYVNNLAQLKAEIHRIAESIQNVALQLEATPDVLGAVKYDGKTITKNDKGQLYADVGNAEIELAESAERSNIKSGESQSTLWGKVKKFFTDLKPHAFCAPIDNLLATVTGYCLDARQGKVLNEKFNNYLPLTGGTVSGNVTVAKTGSNQAIFGVKNANHHAYFTVSTANNVGIWSETLQKWIVKCGLDGVVTVDGKEVAKANHIHSWTCIDAYFINGNRQIGYYNEYHIACYINNIPWLGIDFEIPRAALDNMLDDGYHWVNGYMVDDNGYSYFVRLGLAKNTDGLLIHHPIILINNESQDVSNSTVYVYGRN